MDQLQKAGRHSSYATQFFRSRIKPTHGYRTRRDMRRAESQKAIERRLVLPLETQHWVRALEVLGARYARSGKTAEHYQRVIRTLVEQTAPHARNRASSSYALDTIRSEAYAGEIPTSSALWVTMLWGYCTLEQPQTGLECFLQAQRRERLSAFTRMQMAEQLFPVLCRHGQLEGATLLLKEHILKEGIMHADGSPVQHSAGEQARMHTLLAEAAARSGDWSKALQNLKDSPLLQHKSGAATQGNVERTVNSLFAAVERSAPRPPSSSSPSSSSTTPQQQKEEMDAELRQLSRPALRSLLRSLSEHANATAAVQCYEVLYGPWSAFYHHKEGSTAASSRALLPVVEDVLYVMNALGACDRWQEVLDVFCALYLHAPFADFLALETTEALHEGKSSLPALDVFAEPMETSGLVALPMDERLLNMAFTAFPLANGAEEGGNGGLEPVQHPTAMVQLLDHLLWRRDDLQLTDYVLAKAVPALLQLGQLDRALQLLRQAPSFQHANRAAKKETAGDAAVRNRLVQLVYLLHHNTTIEAKCFTLQHFPFLFPPEVYQNLPPLEELPAYFRAQAEAAQKAWEAQEEVRLMSDEARLERRDAQRGPATSLRPNRQHYYPTRSATELTEEAEQKMQRNFASLFAQSRHPDATFIGNPDDDPRPVPKGLHDRASGWNFYGRGGEMVFSNSRKTAHPLSMWPKLMRSLGNPYRGWSPKQNSSLAHRENVVKWNGRSSV